MVIERTDKFELLEKNSCSVLKCKMHLDRSLLITFHCLPKSMSMQFSVEIFSSSKFCFLNVQSDLCTISSLKRQTKYN